MSTPARHARPVTRIRGTMRLRVIWRLGYWWRVFRYAVRSSTPENARQVMFRLFLIAGAGVLGAGALGILPRRITAAAILTVIGGSLAFFLTLDHHLRSQRRRWRQEPGTLVGLPSEGFADEYAWRRRMETRLNAAIDAIDGMCAVAGLDVEPDPERPNLTVIEGGKGGSAA